MTLEQRIQSLAEAIGADIKTLSQGSTAADISFTPLVDGNAEDVQGALYELITGKLDKSGGYVTGPLVLYGAPIELVGGGTATITDSYINLSGNYVWHSGNDGVGSGLDADLLDGYHASSFALESHTHSYLPLSGGTVAGPLTVNGPQEVKFQIGDGVDNYFRIRDNSILYANFAHPEDSVYSSINSFAFASKVTKTWNGADDESVGFAYATYLKTSAAATGDTMYGISNLVSVQNSHSIGGVYGSFFDNTAIPQVSGTTINTVYGGLTRAVYSTLPTDTGGTVNYLYGDYVNCIYRAIQKTISGTYTAGYIAGKFVSASGALNSNSVSNSLLITDVVGQNISSRLTATSNTSAQTITCTNLYGCRVVIGSSPNDGISSINLTNRFGLHVSDIASTTAPSGSYSVSKGYGLYLDGLVVGVGGTVGTYYGAYLGAATISGTCTTRYGLYVADTANNYFAGNVGIGATPNAWNSASTALELGALLAFESNTNGFANVAYNMYRNSSGVFVYKATGYASAATQYNGEHHWYSAPSGTSGASVPVVRNMRLETGGYLDVLAGFKVNGSATAGQYLRGNGTGFVSSAIQASDVPTLNQNTTGSAGSVAWSGVTSKPTTLAGYGITDAQPLDADLTTIAALTPSADAFIVGDGTGWVKKSGAAALTALGMTTVGTGDFVRAINPLLSGVRYTQTVGGLSGSGQGAVVIPVTSDHFTVTNGLVGGDSVTLPVGITGKQITVTNATGSDIFVYPAVDEEIWPTGSTDLPYPLATGQSCIFTYAIGFSEAFSGAAWIPKSMFALPVTSVDGQTGAVNLSGTYLPLSGGTLTGDLLVGTSTNFTTSTVPGAVAVGGYGVYPIQGPNYGLTIPAGLVYQNSTIFAGDNGASHQYLWAQYSNPRISNSGANGAYLTGCLGNVAIPDIVSSGTNARLNVYGMYSNVSRYSATDTSQNVSSLFAGVFGQAAHSASAATGIKANQLIGVVAGSTNYNGTVTSQYGLYAQNYVAGHTSSLNATTTNLYGIALTVNQVGTTSGPTGTVTTGYGLYLTGLNVGATGTVGTYYGAYIGAATISGTCTTRYGIYVADTATNYLAGNLVIGATPNAWNSGVKAMQIGATTSLLNDGTGSYYGTNWYYGASGFIYQTTAAATYYGQLGGQHRWYSAVSGTAGTAISFTKTMVLDESGYLSALAGFKINATATSGQYLRGNGTGFVSSAIQAADIPTLNQNTTGSAGSVAWSGVTSKPTTLAGYGITDAASSTHTHSYLPLAGGTMAGAITFAAAQTWPTFASVTSTGDVKITSTGGLGYGTGSGGAVTQATSRTTGVTLNKTNGSITLVSAAGSTTWQSFTVTNSTVAATDTIIVNQKSGTDLYEIHVTAVAAGSFRVSFKTTAGATTEQPVFNFAVIKAVTA